MDARKRGSTGRAEPAASTVDKAEKGSSSKPLPRPLQHPVAFKAAIYAKGWSLKALAAHWGITPDGLLKVARDENRSVYYDDAVRGLRKIGPPIKLRRAWSAALAGEPVPPPPRRAPGLRHRGYFVVGAVVAAIKAIGSIAEEGMHGIVVQVVADRAQEVYRVLFETGELEMFTPDLVDEYLQDVGLLRAELAQYRYVDDATVMAEFGEGQFQFA